MGRFTPEKHKPGRHKLYEKSGKLVVAGVGHIKHTFLKHYQVFLIIVIRDLA